jgi:hypothetical protein
MRGWWEAILSGPSRNRLDLALRGVGVLIVVGVVIFGVNIWLVAGVVAVVASLRLWLRVSRR